MLDPGVRFEGFDTDDWTRLFDLLRMGGSSDPDAGLVVVHERGRVVKAFRTEGNASLASGQHWPQPLAEVGARHGARWVMAVHIGALDAWAEGIASHVKRRHDMLDQLLLAWEQARKLSEEGRLETWPTPVSSIPVPTRAMLLGALGLICPPEQALVLAAWDRGGLWTSLAIRRSTEGFDWIVGPDQVRGLVEAGADEAAMWERLLGWTRERLGPVALGIAGRHETWVQLGRSREAGAWARAVASGEMRVDPFPRGLAVPLAVDASRMAWLMLRSALGRRMGTTRSPEADGAWGFAQLWRVAQGLWSLQGRAK